MPRLVAAAAPVRRGGEWNVWRYLSLLQFDRGRRARLGRERRAVILSEELAGGVQPVAAPRGERGEAALANATQLLHCTFTHGAADRCRSSTLWKTPSAIV